MKRLLFTVRDVKAENFANPFVCESKGVAMRMFGDVVADAKTMFSQHPEDFALYQLGEFDMETGVIKGLDTPLHICNATELIVKE